MAIAFGSINTGLPKDIVQQLMAAEKIPIQNMEERKGKFVDKMKLVDEVIGLVNDLRGELLKGQTAKGLRELKTSFREDLVNVIADKNTADSSSFQLEVVQLAKKSSAMSSGFSDPKEAYLGVGYFSYELPNGESQKIYIDQANANLKGLGQLVNNNLRGEMTAKVINDGSGSDTPWRLLLAFKDTGNEKLVSFPHFYLVDGEEDFSLEFEREAQNAKIKLDGFEIELPENKTSELIEGVTIELKKSAPEEEFTVGISENTKEITGKVSVFVDKINAILKFINDQNAIDKTTDTSRTLGGDITLTTFESKIRSVVFRPYMTSSGKLRFGDLGARFQKDGLLKFDKEKFESILNEDFKGVSELLSGVILDGGKKTEGLIQSLEHAIDSVLRFPDGALISRKKGIQGRIDQIDRQIIQREKVIEQKERGLKNKFARLESTMNSIRAQGAGLQSLTGGKAADPVTKLGQ